MHIDIAIGVDVGMGTGVGIGIDGDVRILTYIHPAQASTPPAQMLLGSARTAESPAQKGDWSEACGHMTTTHPAS